MKRSFLWMRVLLAVSIFLTGTGPLWAEAEGEGAPEYMVGDKLLRGFANVLTAPLEVPRCVQNVTEEQGVFVGWTAGMALGVGMTALRIIVGAYDIVTFPIPFPEGYRPVIQPEFVWQAKGPKLTPQGKPAS